jgi:hypothetical protein
MKKAAQTKAAPRPRDPRSPAPGTVIRKLDRRGAVRYECTVLEEGISCKDTTFRSLSGAAMAAPKDVGLSSSANGFLFWGAIKQPVCEADPIASLEKAWERFRERAHDGVAGAKNDDARARLKDAIAPQSSALAEITAHYGSCLPPGATHRPSRRPDRA